jgi:hypothetical protein
VPAVEPDVPEPVVSDPAPPVVVELVPAVPEPAPLVPDIPAPEELVLSVPVPPVLAEPVWVERGEPQKVSATAAGITKNIFFILIVLICILNQLCYQVVTCSPHGVDIPGHFYTVQVCK